MPIKKQLALATFAVAIPCAAQTVFVYPATPIAPKGTYQTVTAIVNGVNNQTVTFSTDGGSIVGTNPCVANEPCTVALYSASAATYHLTATSNANPGVSATSTITFTASPTPTTGNPKLLMTPAMQAGLQAKAANASDVVYPIIKTKATTYYSNDSSIWTYSTWNGSACVGGTQPAPGSQAGNYRELDVFWLTQAALWDPSSTTKNQYGCAARDIFLSVANDVISGALGLPGNRFSDSAIQFSVDADWLLGTPYLTGSDITTARQYLYKLAYSDINNTGNGVIAPVVAGGGNYNSVAAMNMIGFSYPTVEGMRGMGNNYTHTKIEEIAGAALTFDDTTLADPTLGQNAVIGTWVNAGGSGWAVGDNFTTPCGYRGVVTTISGGGGTGPAVMLATITPSSGCSAGTATATAVGPSVGTGLTVNMAVGNTCGATRGNLCNDGSGANLHAYWGYIAGTMLYRQWATDDDPAVTQAAYNAVYGNMATAPQCATNWGGQVPCLGINRGGESVEGYIYGTSTGKLRWAMNEIHTAGYDDPLLYGPQVSGEESSSYWDLRYLSDYSFLLGMSGNFNIPAHKDMWTHLDQGDSNTYQMETQYGTVEASIASYDTYIGRTDRLNALNWFALNVAYGKAAGTTGSCSANCGWKTQLSEDIGSVQQFDNFITFPASDPTVVSPPTDPRSSLPTDWYDAGNQHVETHDGTWGDNTGMVFSEFCNNTVIDHEHEACGGFDIYSNGEYLTKGRMGFNDYNDAMSLAQNKNILSIVQTTNGGTNCLPTPSYCSFWPSTQWGGQFWHDYQAGVVNQVHSEMPGYVAFVAPMTNVYNGGNGTYASYNRVVGASRSALYIRSSTTPVVFTYDRADTSPTTYLKGTYLNTTGAATVVGNTATWLTHSGNQKAAWTALLPASGASFAYTVLPFYPMISTPYSTLATGTGMQATCTSQNVDGTTTSVTGTAAGYNGYWWSDTPSAFTVSATGYVTAAGAAGTYGTLYCYYKGTYTRVAINIGSSSSGSYTNVGSDTDQTNDWEIYGQLSNTISTTATQFLSVFQAGPSGSFTPATASAVASSAGNGFDGALMGGTLAMFHRNLSETFTGVTYPASGATTHYVSDLTPNTSYAITGAGAPSSATTDNAGVLAFAATGTGNIIVGAGSAPTTSTFSGVFLSGVSTQ